MQQVLFRRTSGVKRAARSLAAHIVRSSGLRVARTSCGVRVGVRVARASLWRRRAQATEVPDLNEEDRVSGVEKYRLRSELNAARTRTKCPAPQGPPPRFVLASSLVAALRRHAGRSPLWSCGGYRPAHAMPVVPAARRRQRCRLGARRRRRAGLRAAAARRRRHRRAPTAAVCHRHSQRGDGAVVRLLATGPRGPRAAGAARAAAAAAPRRRARAASAAPRRAGRALPQRAAVVVEAPPLRECTERRPTADRPPNLASRRRRRRSPPAQALARALRVRCAAHSPSNRQRARVCSARGAHGCCASAPPHRLQPPPHRRRPRRARARPKCKLIRPTASDDGRGERAAPS